MAHCELRVLDRLSRIRIHQLAGQQTVLLAQRNRDAGAWVALREGHVQSRQGGVAPKLLLLPVITGGRFIGQDAILRRPAGDDYKVAVRVRKRAMHLRQLSVVNGQGANANLLYTTVRHIEYSADNSEIGLLRVS